MIWNWISNEKDIAEVDPLFKNVFKNVLLELTTKYSDPVESKQRLIKFKVNSDIRNFDIDDLYSNASIDKNQSINKKYYNSLFSQKIRDFYKTLEIIDYQKVSQCSESPKKVDNFFHRVKEVIKGYTSDKFKLFSFGFVIASLMSANKYVDKNTDKIALPFYLCGFFCGFYFSKTDFSKF